MAEKITLNLEVKLTAEELQAKGQEMALAVLKYDEYEAEKKEIAKDLGDKMKELHGKLSAMAKVTRRRTDIRPVECIVHLDTPEVGTKRIVRGDTEEVLKEMAMTPDERQRELFDKSSIEALNKMFELKSDETEEDEPEEKTE